MRLDVWVAGLPGLEVEVDLELRLFVAEGVRDLDEQGVLALFTNLAVRSTQELDELLARRWVDLDPHDPRTAHFGS